MIQPVVRRRNSGGPLNALSFDIEDYFHASALKDAFGGRGWEQLPSRVVGNTRKLLDLLDQESVKATFFVLGWVAEQFGELVRDIHARGHEVACHGYSHQLIYNQTREVFEQETRKAKSLLEDSTGVAVQGYRAASFSVTRRSLWALDVIADAGFRYDSSIFPVHHDRYGVPGAPRFPHTARLTGGRCLLEFPPSTIRVAGLTLPTGGGGYFRLFPYAYTHYSLQRLNEWEKRPMMFYLHPWEVDTGQPRGTVSALTRIRHYRNIDQCESRLRRMVREWNFGTVAQVLQADDPDRRLAFDYSRGAA